MPPDTNTFTEDGPAACRRRHTSDAKVTISHPSPSPGLICLSSPITRLCEGDEGEEIRHEKGSMRQDERLVK